MHLLHDGAKQRKHLARPCQKCKGSHRRQEQNPNPHFPNPAPDMSLFFKPPTKSSAAGAAAHQRTHAPVPPLFSQTRGRADMPVQLTLHPLLSRSLICKGRSMHQSTEDWKRVRAGACHIPQYFSASRHAALVHAGVLHQCQPVQ